jgi:hypothetical protein
VSLHNTDKEVLERVSDLRRDAGPLRAEIACRICLAFGYNNGQHWNRVERRPETGEVFDFPLDEDWDPHSREIRVVDNRIAPLMRNMAARTHPTVLEASVQPPRHRRTIDVAKQARVAQNVLNGLDKMIGSTRVAQDASYHRWIAGSSLLNATLSRKTMKVPADAALNPDGSPVEIDDQWLRWEMLPLCDLIWEPSNTSARLEDHTVLVVERVLTQRIFEQTYGPIGRFGFKEEELPKMSDMAPHYVAAAQVDGCNLFDSYRNSEGEHALRVLTLIESDPKDPTRWPEHYVIVDITPYSSAHDRIAGRVVNMSSVGTPFGNHGRSVFKLDAFKTGDSVWSWGVPNVLMGHNDMINILRSIQFQQLTAAVFGHWLIDERHTNKENFANDLTMGIGGVVAWDSGGDKQSHPPQWVTPNAPASEFVTLVSDISMGMDAQVHISQMNKGIGKTHVPENIQQLLLQESGAVLDIIITGDKQTYSDALKTLLGTIRKTADGPNRMLARLKDEVGFTTGDLEQLQAIDPENIALRVEVREESITSRSISERRTQLNESLELGIIGPDEYILENAMELERPITAAQEKEIQFIHSLIIDISEGEPFQGMPSLNTGLFENIARMAIHGLDLNEPDSRQTIALLEQAMEIQRQIALEMAQQMQGVAEQEQGQAAQGEQFSALPPLQGPPESINPITSPTGAAGGLPLGLPAAVA